MSKYIINLSDDCNMVQQICITENCNVYIKAEYAENLEELNSDYINEHFSDLQDTAYQRGLEDGKQVAVGAAELREKLEYQKGFKDGKAVHEKGCEGCLWEGSRVVACTNCCNAYKNQWTAKDDKIEVGDEVEWDNDFTGDRFIVTRIYQPYGKKEQCDGIDDDGDVYRAVLIESLVKTGRHFDIATILEDMRND